MIPASIVGNNTFIMKESRNTVAENVFTKHVETIIHVRYAERLFDIALDKAHIERAAESVVLK